MTQLVADFGEKVLGKVVFAKDADFIANRIGTYGICSVFAHGNLADDSRSRYAFWRRGTPRLGVFGLGDLLTLDTLVHVLGNVYNDCLMMSSGIIPAARMAHSYGERRCRRKQSAERFLSAYEKRDSQANHTGSRPLNCDYAPKVRPKFASVSGPSSNPGRISLSAHCFVERTRLKTAGTARRPVGVFGQPDPEMQTISSTSTEPCGGASWDMDHLKPGIASECGQRPK